MPLPEWINQKNRLHVEGPDDFHSILHLLVRHGIPYEARPLNAELPRILDVGGIALLLDGMGNGIKASTGRAIGFVVDADSPLADRWQAIRGRLDQSGVAALDSPPAAGFVETSALYDARVGVWLMPDNQQDGKLETFLRFLVDADDTLIGHAEAATAKAKEIGARFTEPDHIKAVLHAWLAWQKEPGRPFGVAMQAKYFRHDSPAANAFVAWFKTLYGIPDRAQSGPGPGG
jgi:hypothetical protein